MRDSVNVTRTRFIYSRERAHARQISVQYPSPGMPTSTRPSHPKSESTSEKRIRVIRRGNVYSVRVCVEPATTIN